MYKCECYDGGGIHFEGVTATFTCSSKRSICCLLARVLFKEKRTYVYSVFMEINIHSSFYAAFEELLSFFVDMRRIVSKAVFFRRF